MVFESKVPLTVFFVHNFDQWLKGYLTDFNGVDLFRAFVKTSEKRLDYLCRRLQFASWFCTMQTMSVRMLDMLRSNKSYNHYNWHPARVLDRIRRSIGPSSPL